MSTQTEKYAIDTRLGEQWLRKYYRKLSQGETHQSNYSARYAVVMYLRPVSEW